MTNIDSTPVPQHCSFVHERWNNEVLSSIDINIGNVTGYRLRQAVFHPIGMEAEAENVLLEWFWRRLGAS